jgi:hypothetical protein
MAYIKPVILNFTPAPDDGATSYGVWATDPGVTPEYDDEYTDIGMQTQGINLGALLELDGSYDIYVAARDDVGNMSDFLQVASNHPFDLVAPLAPVSGSVS